MAVDMQPNGLLQQVEEAGPSDCDSKQVQKAQPGLENICGPLNCRLCDVTLNSVQQGHAHYQGRKHSRKLRQFLSWSSGSVTSERLSNVSFRLPDVARAHGMNYKKRVCSVKSQKKIDKSQILNYVGGVLVPKRQELMAGAYNTCWRRIPRDLTMTVTPSGSFYCSLCDCGAEQELDFRRHLGSKAHKSRAYECLYRIESENLGHS